MGISSCRTHKCSEVILSKIVLSPHVCLFVVFWLVPRSHVLCHMGHFKHDLQKATHLKTNLRLGEQFLLPLFAIQTCMCRSLDGLHKTMTKRDKRRVHRRFQRRQRRRQVPKVTFLQNHGHMLAPTNSLEVMKRGKQRPKGSNSTNRWVQASSHIRWRYTIQGPKELTVPPRGKVVEIYHLQRLLHVVSARHCFKAGKLKKSPAYPIWFSLCPIQSRKAHQRHDHFLVPLHLW